MCHKILTAHGPLFKVTLDHWNWRGSSGYLWLPINVP